MSAEVRSTHGFTLAELLIALAIFAVLMAIVSQSLGMTAGVLDRLDARYAPEARALGRLHDAIGSAACYVVRDDGGLGDETSYRFYFHADDRELRFITRQPVSLTEMAVARLRREGETLIIEEVPLFGGEVDYRQPSLPPASTVRRVLLEDVSDFSVEAVPERTNRMPRAVRLTIQQRDRKREVTIRLLANDHSRLDAMRALEYWKNPDRGMP